MKAEKFSLMKEDAKKEPLKAAKKVDEEDDAKEGDGDAEEGGSVQSDDKETAKENEVQVSSLPANGSTAEYTSEVYSLLHLLISSPLSPASSLNSCRS